MKESDYITLKLLISAWLGVMSHLSIVIEVFMFLKSCVGTLLESGKPASKVSV